MTAGPARASLPVGNVPDSGHGSDTPIRDWNTLAAFLGLTDAEVEERRAAAAAYPVLVSRYYLSLARSSSPDDPILKQCVPSPAELDPSHGQTPDPLDEDHASPVPGLIHRYPDRVLLLLNSRCAVHCRHCFRKRHWRTPVPDLTGVRLGTVVDYLRKHPQVREVILSGGDPLLAPVRDLEHLLSQLGALPNIEIVRIGSRLPVVFPHRFTPEFCALFDRTPPVWLITHFNHPWEITPESKAACENLVRAGVPVVNQTVLLRGVNDSVETLRALCTGLLRIRVKPYYLLLADPAQGAMHFRTSIEAARELVRSLRSRMSGLAMPTLALDLPDGGGKVVLEAPPEHPPASPGGLPRFVNFQGGLFTYPECRDSP